MIELTGFLLLVIFWLGFIPISLFAFKLSIDF